MIEQQDTCEIDGLAFPWLHPGSVEELAELVVRARSEKEAIFPVGGATKLGYGLPPARQGKAVGVGKLAQVIDYPARDMTITAQTGITVGELRRVLATENQRLPIDVPRSESATLGGIVAANVSGLRRYGWGTLRDYVIGISLLNDEGQIIKAGGRVVKNVAGYDLCKLSIGSLGTLGILTQITLKVLPQTEQHALLTLACPENALENLLEKLHGTATRPIAIEVLNAAAVHLLHKETELELEPDQWLVVVGYESNADAVNWQVQQLIKEVKTDYSLEARVGPTALPLWQALEELPAWAGARLTFRAAMLPSRCPDFCRQLAKMSPQAVIQAHAGNGIVMTHLGEDADSEQARALVEQCRKWLGENGSVVILNCPADWKSIIAVWGPARDDVKLMRKIKEKLDPDGLFNPGRFVDGI